MCVCVVPAAAPVCVCVCVCVCVQRGAERRTSPEWTPLKRGRAADDGTKCHTVTSLFSPPPPAMTAPSKKKMRQRQTLRVSFLKKNKTLVLFRRLVHVYIMSICCGASVVEFCCLLLTCCYVSRPIHESYYVFQLRIYISWGSSVFPQSLFKILVNTMLSDCIIQSALCQCVVVHVVCVFKGLPHSKLINHLIWTLASCLCWFSYIVGYT